jgi:hypothetical protein
MNKHISYREESRKDYGQKYNDEFSTDPPNFTIEQLNAGCLLRIADASEAMAKNHNALISENKYLTERINRVDSSNRFLNRSASSLKGHITRLRKKMEAAEDRCNELKSSPAFISAMSNTAENAALRKENDRLDRSNRALRAYIRKLKTSSK